MLAELIHAVRGLDEIEQINLAVAEHNVQAKRLYESMGFTPFGTEVHALKLDDHTCVNEVHMVKRLKDL